MSVDVLCRWALERNISGTVPFVEVAPHMATATTA